MGNAATRQNRLHHLLMEQSNNSPTQAFGLTTVQIRLIRKSWCLARRQGLDEPGRSILLEIFRQQPIIEKKFGRRKYENGAWRESSFYLHGNRFTIMLDDIIKNLENLQLIEEKLKRMGQRHAELPEEGLFQPQYWDAFAEALIEKSLNWGTGFRNHRNSAMRVAWIQIVLFITEKMKDGYQKQVKVRQSAMTALAAARSAQAMASSRRSTIKAITASPLARIRSGSLGRRKRK